MPSLGTPLKKFKNVQEDVIIGSKVKKVLFFTPALAKMKKEGLMNTPVKSKPPVKAYNYGDLDKVKKRLTFDDFLDELSQGFEAKEGGNEPLSINMGLF